MKQFGVAVPMSGGGSNHSSNAGSGSGRSRGSSGGRRALHPAPEPAELQAAQTQHGMGALPEDSTVIGERQVGPRSTQLPTLIALCANMRTLQDSAPCGRKERCDRKVRPAGLQERQSAEKEEQGWSRMAWNLGKQTGALQPREAATALTASSHPRNSPACQREGNVRSALNSPCCPYTGLYLHRSVKWSCTSVAIDQSS